MKKALNQYNASYFITLVFVFLLLSCKENSVNQHNSQKLDHISSDLQVDHFNIWVNNPQKAKERLTDIGFTVVPDSLSTIHEGQGTTGRYFYFLNSYLELIFIYDQNEFEQNNLTNRDLDFAERADFQINDASPLGIGLKVKDYDVAKIPFQKVEYHQEWMGEGVSIYSAKNSKTNLAEPSMFVVYPEIEFDTFETLSDLTKIPEEYAIWRDFYKHPNGAKKITAIILTSTGVDLTTETVRAVNNIENLTVKNGSEHLMELFFDDTIQKKSFDLRPDLPLVVHL